MSAYAHYIESDVLKIQVVFDADGPAFRYTSRSIDHRTDVCSWTLCVINSQRSSVDGWSHLPRPPLSPQPSVCCWQHVSTRRCCQQLIDRRPSLVCIALANGGRAMAKFSKFIWEISFLEISQFH